MINDQVEEDEADADEDHYDDNNEGDDDKRCLRGWWQWGIQ